MTKWGYFRSIPHRRRQWQPTSVLLPGKSHGQRSLIGCCLWGHIESNTPEQPHFYFSLFMHWRRKWQPTPVFLPGESQGGRSLAGCRLWGRRVGHDWSALAAAAAGGIHTLATEWPSLIEKFPTHSFQTWPVAKVFTSHTHQNRMSWSSILHSELHMYPEFLSH